MEVDGERLRSNSSKRRRYIPIIVIIAAVILFGYAGFWLARSTTSTGVPAELSAAKGAVPYTLYYPTQLPKGVSYVSASLKPSNTVTIYSLTVNGEKIFVSVEPKPKGVVFDDFYNRVLTNKADVFSTLGKGAIGLAHNQIVGSLITDDIWVLVNAPLTIDKQTIQSIISNLAPVK